MAEDNSEYGSPASAKRKADTPPPADDNDNLAPPAKRVKTPTEDVADPTHDEQEPEAQADMDNQEGRPSVSPAASGKSSPIESGRRQQQQQHYHHHDDLLATADMLQSTPSMKPIPPTTLEGYGDGDVDAEMSFPDEPHFVDKGPEDHSEPDKPALDAISTPRHDHHQLASATTITDAASGSVDVQVLSDPTEAEHDHNSEVASSKDVSRPEPLSSLAGKGLDAAGPSSRPVSLVKDQAAAQVKVSQFWVATLGKDQREKALASCAPSTYLNDDVINASLEILTSKITHLRTLSTLLVNSEEKTLQQAIRRIPPLSVCEKGVPAQPGKLSHLVLTFGFQPVDKHWGLAWLDFDARTADIYDSNPSMVEGQFQKACHQVRRLIKLLPAPYNLDTEWSIQAAPFVTQSNYEDCGVYAIAAAFYRAAGLSAPVPGPSVALDGSLWRLICKSFLINQTSSSASDSPILSVLGDFIPKFNDQVPLPSAPVTTGSFIAAADIAGNVKAHYRYIRELQTVTVETFAARRTSALDMAKLLRFVRDALVPVSDADADDEASLQQTIKQLENEETCGDSALTSLQGCNSMSFAESITRLQIEVNMVRKCKMGAKARYAAMRYSRDFFIALGKVLGLVADESDKVADKYNELMGPMYETLEV